MVAGYQKLKKNLKRGKIIMKKIVGMVLLCMGLGSSLFAQANIEVVNKNNGNTAVIKRQMTQEELMEMAKQEFKEHETKKFHDVLFQIMPNSANVVNAYFSAKKCTQDFTKVVTVSEVKEFMNFNPAYGSLLGLLILDMNDEYLKILNDFEFMNCGKGKLSVKK